MLKTKLAKKVLTKKDQRHLTEMNIHSMATFLTTRDAQIRITERSLKDGLTPGMAEACWDCKEIARKLGIKGG